MVCERGGAPITHDNKRYPFDFSVIAPCFNEEDAIKEFHSRLVQTLARMDYSFEIIYVNDGSGDATLDCLLKVCTDDQLAIRVVDLVQNVGQTNAMTAGIELAAGRHMIIMDCDLQVAPEDVCLLLDFFDDSYDMVSGARRQRKDNFWRRNISRMGNAIIRKIVGLPVHDFGSSMRIVNGAFMRAFAVGPFHPLNPGAVMLCLEKIAEVPITHYARGSGRSRWTLRHFFVLYNSIFRPLVPFFFPFTVVPILAVSLMLLGYFFLATIAPHRFESGPPALIFLLVTFGVTLSLMNLLLTGEFILRGSGQAQGPAYIVRRVFITPNHPGKK